MEIVNVLSHEQSCRFLDNEAPSKNHHSQLKRNFDT
jgi:hypothetical protein